MTPRMLLVCALLAATPLAGCLGDADETGPGTPQRPAPSDTLDLNGSMAFEPFVVGAAVHKGVGLYEPTIDVSDSGVIYISAHTAGVDTTGAPAFFSTDDGATWQQLPFAQGLTVPSPIHGGTPPPSDEIFIVAGDDGQAWGVDITLLTYPVNGWCGDGSEHCYHNPNAYNRQDTANACSAASLNDRPWAAYANDTLLMVNNPGGGPVQIGVMQVPPPQYVEAVPPRWNMCASSGGFIPGIPDMRDDLFFAVPQFQNGKFVVVTGNAQDIMDVTEYDVFTNSHVRASEVGHYGQAVFDADGSLFVGAMANPDGQSGAIQLAASTDDGQNFTERTFTFDRPVSSLYMDGNAHGPGAIVNWGLVDGDRTDWYIGHLFIGADGAPEIRDASLAVDDGPHASRHVQGAAVGPDGRSYMVMSEVSGNDEAESVSLIGTTPMTVVVQQDGPVLPVREA